LLHEQTQTAPPDIIVRVAAVLLGVAKDSGGFRIRASPAPKPTRVQDAASRWWRRGRRPSANGPPKAHTSLLPLQGARNQTGGPLAIGQRKIQRREPKSPALGSDDSRGSSAFCLVWKRLSARSLSNAEPETASGVGPGFEGLGWGLFEAWGVACWFLCFHPFRVTKGLLSDTPPLGIHLPKSTVSCSQISALTKSFNVLPRPGNPRNGIWLALLWGVA